MLTYYLFRIATYVVPILPIPLGYWLAARIGDIMYCCQKRRRSIVYNNIRHALGEDVAPAQIVRTVRQVFRNGAMNYYDLFRVPSLRPLELRKVVSVHGLENLERCLAHEKGVILVAPHLGSFDLVAQVTAAYSVKVTIPVERIRPEKLFNLVTSIRAANGIRLVPVGGGALKEVRAALSRNEIVVIASDRDVLGNGIRVSFFGEETTVPDAAAVLASRTGARVLPGCSVREADGRYAIYIGSEIALQRSDDAREDIKVNSQRIVQALESYIRMHPEQWVVFEPIWNKN